MDTRKMLDNAAVAAQSNAILAEPVTRGAILRSVHQWINAHPEWDPGDFLAALEADPDFEQ